MVDAYYLGRAYDEGYCDFKADKNLAVVWYRKAAADGHTLAEYELGETYFTGDGTDIDYPQAKKWYQKAAEQGHGLSQLRLGFLNAEAHFAGLKTNYAEAEKWFTKAAEQDAGDARFRLGNFYNNYKEPRDYGKALLWLKRAAEGGHHVAMYDLARLLQQGKPGIAKNDKVALEWMTKAADEGLLQAQIQLAEMYGHGQNVAKNIPEALKWTMKIANDPGASVFWIDKAGDIFFEGWETVPKNYPMARRFYERAAAKGDATALTRLADMYRNGLGVEKDEAKADEYLKKAAPQPAP
jgi:TPR repeat protein